MTNTKDTIQKRRDFVLFFDVQDGNPNGDPDAGNLPRIDPETGHGLVTDVCIKRKVRNYVLTAKNGAEGLDVFIKEKSVLNQAIADEYRLLKIDLEKDPADARDGKKRKDKGEAQGSEVDRGRAAMCDRYFDVRTFGAVMSTGANAGQVRGPVQLTFARSIDPILSLEHSITRMAVATEEEAEKQGGDNRTMGRKATVPYALYRAHGFVSPALAERVDGRRVQGTGFGDDDLALLWTALENMFEHDRSAARGLMSTRALVIFEHGSKLGERPAHELFARVEARKKADVPRSIADYVITLDGTPLVGVKHVIKVSSSQPEATA
ncbi:MAG: type I-C CRISPR-associated protein Cas7/Csd2 [Polyangiaceae bacterium]